MFSNPIVQRELIGTLRSHRALAVQLALVAVLSVLVIGRWPSEDRVGASAEQSQQVFSVFAYGLMVGVILLAPVFPATSIVRERQQGTLRLLLNSPMTAATILSGKVIGTVGFVLLLLLLSLPPAAACYTMGGIDLKQQVVPAYVVLFAASIQYGMLALVTSTYASTTDAALRVTYGFILLLAVITLGPYQFLQSLVTGWPATVIDWVRCASPIPAMMEATHHSGLETRGTSGAGSAIWRYLILAAGSILVFVIWTGMRLNFRLFDRARTVGKVTDDRSAGARAYRRVMFLWFFDPRRRTGLIGPLTNPVMVKEFRTRKFGRSHWLLRLFGFFMIISLGLMLASTRSTIDWGVSTLAAILVLLSIGLIILITPSLASGLISGERESGGWKLLMLTPLSAPRIVSGKLMSVAWTLAMVLMSTLPAYVMLEHLDVAGQIPIRDTLISLLLTAVFALLLTAMVSSLCLRTAVATTVSYVILVFLCAGTLLFWVGYQKPFTHGTVEMALAVNPLAGALSLIEAPGFTQFELYPANWWFMGIACVCFTLVLLVQTWRLTRPQ